MLYISRIVAVPQSIISERVGFKYGVVDTDDDSEQLVDDAYIVAATRNHKLHINGVERGYGGDFKRYSIIPYQLDSDITPNQLKLRLMTGVALTIWRNQLTKVSWGSLIGPRPIHIRLSDYVTSCADFVVNGLTIMSPVIEFVLDDKLSFGRYSFVGQNVQVCGNRGICFDIREITRLESAYRVYDMFHFDWLKCDWIIPNKILKDMPGRRADCLSLKLKHRRA